MPEFFAPMPDIQSDVMRPIDPLLMIEDGYQQGGYAVGLGSFDIDMLSDQGDRNLGVAPVDPMIPSDIGTPAVHIFDPAHSFTSPALNGLSDVMDVFSMARFLTEGR